MQTTEFNRIGTKTYTPPQLVSLGDVHQFVLGGPNPAGNDVANPEIDGSTS